VDELPAGAARLALLAIAGDAVANTVEPAELLDVDVDHLAGMGTFVALDRIGWLEVLEPLPARLSTRLTVAGDTPTSSSM
jgi:hypothetical protein